MLNARIQRIFISETIGSTEKYRWSIVCLKWMCTGTQSKTKKLLSFYEYIRHSSNTETKHKTNSQEVNGKFRLCMRFIILLKYTTLHTTFCHASLAFVSVYCVKRNLFCSLLFYFRLAWPHSLTQYTHRQTHRHQINLKYLYIGIDHWLTGTQHFNRNILHATFLKKWQVVFCFMHSFASFVSVVKMCTTFVVPNCKEATTRATVASAQTDRQTHKVLAHKLRD